MISMSLVVIEKSVRDKSISIRDLSFKLVKSLTAIYPFYKCSMNLTGVKISRLTTDLKSFCFIISF